MTLFSVTLAAAGLGSIQKAKPFWLFTIGITLLLAINLVRHPNFIIEDWRSAISTIADDPNGALIVGAQYQGQHMSAACKIESGRSPCPFPIVILSKSEKQVTEPTMPFTRSVPITKGGQLDLPSDANLYLLNRGTDYERPLLFLQHANLLTNVGTPSDFLLGPYPPPAITELKQKSHVVGGVVELPPSD